MFEVSVESEFCAAHALLIDGVREPLHGHNWRVTVTVAGEHLDADGLLVDFHALERSVAEVLRPLNNADLNAAAPLSGQNPSAEVVARHIARAVQSGLTDLGPRAHPGEPERPPHYRVVAVRVTEAPGCSVVYRPL